MFEITRAFSWQNSISIFLASFCTPRPNLPVIPGSSWLLTSAFQFPIMKRTFFEVLVIKGLGGNHRTIQLQFLQHYWSGHRLGITVICPGKLQRSFCHFETASKYCISDFFVDYNGYSISSKEFLPTVVDIMVI